METNIIFYSIAAALIYIILQSLVIIGIRASAKGGTEILPDGTEKDSEMILYPLLKYLTRVKLNKIYYKGAEFNKLMNKIKLSSALEMILDDTHLKISNKELPLSVYIEELQNDLLKIDSKIQLEIEDDLIRFYKIDEQYRISKYFRKPIIQCPICMSSFWSIFSYWIPVIYLFGFSLEVVYLGGLNICAVACMNWLLWTKGHANEAVSKG